MLNLTPKRLAWLRSIRDGQDDPNKDGGSTAKDTWHAGLWEWKRPRHDTRRLTEAGLKALSEADR